jgi:hypothetical protein
LHRKETGDSDASIPVDIGNYPAPTPGPAPAPVPPPAPSPGGDPPKTGWQPQDLLGAPAYAKTPPAMVDVQASMNGLGITARQNNYVVVYGTAASSKDLEPLKTDLQNHGISSNVKPGTRGDYVLVPRDGAIKPYSDAVRAAIGAKAAGANPYLVRVPAQ